MINLSLAILLSIVTCNEVSILVNKPLPVKFEEPMINTDVLFTLNK